jgi:flagellar biosynthesis/type III secretory pathway M-ring protein FliF/YscJ
MSEDEIILFVLYILSFIIILAIVYLIISEILEKKHEKKEFLEWKQGMIDILENNLTRNRNHVDANDLKLEYEENKNE